MVLSRVEAECNEWESIATSLGHENEAHLLHRRCKVVGSAGQVEHDRSVALLSKADELIVLSDDLTSATGEVQSE